MMSDVEVRLCAYKMVGKMDVRCVANPKDRDRVIAELRRQNNGDKPKMKGWQEYEATRLKKRYLPKNKESAEQIIAQAEHDLRHIRDEPPRKPFAVASL